jgi:hypothetical protein
MKKTTLHAMLLCLGAAIATATVTGTASANTAATSKPAASKQKDDHDHAHGAASYDATAGAFHLHVIPVGNVFEVHVHSVAKHESVDLSKARTKATLLADGKTTVIPLTIKGKGILTSAQPLPKQWTLLIALNVPGQPPAQARFTSTKAGKHAH